MSPLLKVCFVLIATDYLHYTLAKPSRRHHRAQRDILSKHFQSKTYMPSSIPGQSRLCWEDCGPHEINMKERLIKEAEDEAVLLRGEETEGASHDDSQKSEEFEMASRIDLDDNSYDIPADEYYSPYYPYMGYYNPY